MFQDTQTGVKYKRCTKCGVFKPITEFYSSSNQSADGLLNSCKLCHREAVNRGREARRRPKSNETVIKHFESHGIPIRSASGIGWDLIAWGCIPIEAKGAHPDRDSLFSFGFTSSQFAKITNNEKHNGFIVFVAYDNKQERIFIVPFDDRWLIDKCRENSSHIKFCLDSVRGQSSRYVMQFENRWDLIEEARLKESQKLKEIKTGF